MRSFNSHFLETLRNKIVLSDIVSRTVRLTRRGRDSVGLCPFHREKTASFTVNDEKGFYHCFGCSEHGSAIDFLMKIEKVSFVEAVEDLAKRIGLELPDPAPRHLSVQTEENIPQLYAVLERATLWFQSQLSSKDGIAAQKYLFSRGIHQETIQLFRLGWSPSFPHALQENLISQGFSQELLLKAGLVASRETNHVQKKCFDRFRKRLIFPIVSSRGYVIGFGGRVLDESPCKYLNSPETPLFSKGKNLYGLWNAKKNSSLRNKPVILVEGYLDVLSIQQAQIGQAVSPMGTACQEDHLRKIWQEDKIPLVCYDADIAGEKAMNRLAIQALSLIKPGFSLKFITLPRGEDPSSLIQNGEHKTFDTLLHRGVSLIDTLWNQAHQGYSTSSTPEDKAFLQEKLSDLVSRVQDAKVRALYKQEFQKRWKSFLFPARKIGRAHV